MKALDGNSGWRSFLVRRQKIFNCVRDIRDRTRILELPSRSPNLGRLFTVTRPPLVKKGTRGANPVNFEMQFSYREQ